MVIQVIDLKQEKESSCRVMICQLNSDDFNWTNSFGLYFMTPDDKISIKVKEFLKIAKHNSVDLILFPELSIPEKLIENIREWSKEQVSIVICGSHYTNNQGKFTSRCPIIINGSVYFTEKIFPSPLEKSPILDEGLKPGSTILKFTNSVIGDFAVLICSDYLVDDLKNNLDIQSLDILCVPSFQRDSDLYHRRMNTDCENSENGIFILYSNFIDTHYGDGNSSVFGLMDRLYTNKLKERNYTDLNPDKKLFHFKNDCEYLIADLHINNKRPFANRNISTDPNFFLISTSNQTKNKDLTFIHKIAHDDERYRRIDELYVPPIEYDDILETLDKKDIVFIIGDPGIGKTYTAAKILKTYYEKGYDPIWFPGLEKEEREIQCKVLSEFVPSDNQIIYFEDPFGRTAFEKRDSLFQVFSPLLDKLANFNSKIIITSRKEIFETFSKESILEKDILKLRKELNIKNPSYDSGSLCQIFNKLAPLICDWFDIIEYRELVYSAIHYNKLNTPLAIRDLVFVSRNIKSKAVLQDHIERRSNESTKVFALEILSTSITTKTILYLIYFCGTKGKPFLSELFVNVSKELIKLNLPITSFSFNIEVRPQIGFRIEQLGFSKTAYLFSHPIYEEALSRLILSDPHCETIAKTIIQELAVKDIKLTYLIINRFVIKSPEVSLLLYKQMLAINCQIDDKILRITLSQKLISTYYSTRDSDYFDLACHFYSFENLIDDINNHFSTWLDLSQKLNLCIRYKNNSPLNFDTSLTDKIDWEKLFSNKNDRLFTSSRRILHLLIISNAINPVSLSTFILKKGPTLLKNIYFLLDSIDRKRMLKLLKGYPIQKELIKYKIEEIKNPRNIKELTVVRNVIFVDYQYFGKIIIDHGAEKAINTPWINLLPIGIINVIGDFLSGSIVGIFSESGKLLCVGVVEYSSEELKKIMKHSTNEFQELIGYYHTCCAVKAEFLKRIKSKEETLKWKYLQN